MASDVKVKIARYQLRRSNGTARIIRAGLGRPKACIAILSNADSEATIDQAVLSIGFYDGANQWSANISAEDGQSSHDSRRNNTSTCIGAIQYNSGSIWNRLGADQFVDNGLDVTLSSFLFDRECYLTLILFGGRGVKAKVGNTLLTASLDDISNPDSITGLGFQPEVVFTSSANTSSSTSTSAEGHLSFGCATGPSTQRCIEWFIDNGSNVFSQASWFDNDYFTGHINLSGRIWQGDLQEFNSDGFKVTTRESTTGTRQFGWLALNLGGLPIHLKTLTTPGTAGNSADTAAGFRPQAVILALSSATAEKTLGTTGVTSEMMGVSAYDEHVAVSTTAASDYLDGSTGTSDTTSDFVRKAARIRDGANNVLNEAAFVSFDNAGDTLNWSDGGAHKCWKLSLSENTAYEQISTITSYIDVTNPPATGTPPANNNGNFDCAKDLQAIFDRFVKGHTHYGNSVIWTPPGIYRLGSMVTIGFADGIRIMGGGLCKSIDSGAAINAYTVFQWSGNTTGPMIQFSDIDGLVLDGLNFDGVIGPDLAIGTPGLSVLIKHNNPSGGSGSLLQEVRSCGFFNAQRLWWASDDPEEAGVSDTVFRHCLWRNGAFGPMEPEAWTGEAYYTDNDQAINTYMDRCEFNSVGVCVRCAGGGRISIRESLLAYVGVLLQLDTTSFNLSGHVIDTIHVDGGPGYEGRKQLYKAEGANDTRGVVVIRNIKHGTDMGDWVGVSGYGTNPNTLTLSASLRMRVGDRILFAHEDSHNVRFAETTVAANGRISDTEYIVADTWDQLGFPSEQEVKDDYHVTWGEPLISIKGGGIVVLQDSQLDDDAIRAGRLARLEYDPAGGNGRVPIFICERVIGFSVADHGSQNKIRTTVNVASEPAWFAFRDCFTIDDYDDFPIPLSVANWGGR
jgi:hypothetical protein